MLAGYLLALFRGMIALLTLPALENTPPELPSWPKLSLVVAACNEESTIEEALKSLLTVDYPDLELIVVNDRSADKTGEIIDRVAKEKPEIRVVHIQELPDGWLGKLNALEQGTRISSGKYVIYTDADVHYTRDVLRRAVALCEKENLGHLALLPKIYGQTVGLMASLPLFFLGYVNALDLPSLGKPGSKAFAGAGAFNMVRREEYEKTEGFSWLKMEIGDDVGLGMMMVEQAGVKSRLATAIHSLEVQWYRNVPELVRGLEKNSFSCMARFEIKRAVGASLIFLGTLTALIGTFFFPFLWTRIAGGIVLAALLLMAGVAFRKVDSPIWSTLLSPLTFPLFSWILMRSTWKTLRSGGITWRGTFYPMDQLKEGQRVKI